MLKKLPKKVKKSPKKVLKKCKLQRRSLKNSNGKIGLKFGDMTHDKIVLAYNLNCHLDLFLQEKFKRNEPSTRHISKCLYQYLNYRQYFNITFFEIKNFKMWKIIGFISKNK